MARSSLSLSRRLSFTIAPLMLFGAAPAFAAPDEDYTALQQDYENWLLRENPEYATVLGDRRFDDRVTDISLAGADRRAAEAQALLDRLNAIATPGLSPVNRVNQAIMRRMLSEVVEGNRHGQRMMLFTTYAGWHQSFASLSDSMPFATLADYRSYLARLRQYPAINREALRITRQAVAAGHVLPCVVLGSTERSISGLIAPDPVQSRYYQPFAGNRPAAISEADWAALQTEARAIISDGINPALRDHRDYFVNDYLPRCTASASISSQPGGSAYYAFRIRAETTTDMSADEIHQLGLSEVARIRSEMEQVAAQAGFASREAMIADMRTNPRWFARTPEELMMRVALVTRRIDGFMPRLFGRLPRLPYTLRQIPAETAEGTTTAYYSQGSPAAGIAGTYYVNTSKLDQRPFWEIPALSMHEAVPGHHHQISLQQELDLPMWRRNFTGFTAFVEGWALYAERLGIEQGLYDTPETNMGRLSYEMWRACRLVVDTGIHARGWTKEQAVAFMRDNSALTNANIDAEVNRYISWPGQALGYKVGELRIRALRDRAEQELGPRFDQRAFHDVLLGQGAVPLDVLETQINDWIASQQAAPAG
ncbi:DUF885 domain-containing protein [Sphingomonas lacunae]|nr:DUF885 domain-containing protein [Sphingomonas lacunae]